MRSAGLSTGTGGAILPAQGETHLLDRLLQHLEQGLGVGPFLAGRQAVAADHGQRRQADLRHPPSIAATGDRPPYRRPAGVKVHRGGAKARPQETGPEQPGRESAPWRCRNPPAGTGLSAGQTGGVTGTAALIWAARVGWAGLAFACGPAFGAALDGEPGLVTEVGSVLLWSAWLVGLVATLLPSPLSLTLLRAAAPGAAAAVAVVAVGAGVDGPFGLAWSLALSALLFAPSLSRWHVNGPAYPNERRYPLRPPGAVLFGPLYLAWAAAVPLPAVGLLVAAEGSAAALLLVPAGAAGVWVGGRALLRLARRWLVFVPAGVVLHDHLALSDPVLFPKQILRAIGPAAPQTGAWDLRLGATGLPVQLTLAEETNLGKSRKGRGLGQVVTADAILISPSRPGLVIREAEDRGLPAGGQAGPPPSTRRSSRS